MDRKELIELKEYKAKIDKEIVELKESINKKTFFQFISRNKQKEELQNLQYKSTRAGEVFNGQLEKFLIQENQEFGKLTEMSRGLLSKNEFILKVSKTDMYSLFNASKQQYSGSIHENGFLYLSLTKVNTGFDEIYNVFTAIEFEGRFNDNGDYFANAKENLNPSFIHRIPQFFIAQGKPDGKFVMASSKEGRQMSKYEIVEKMVGDPFLGDEQDREQFLSNRKMINAIRNEFSNAL